MTQTCHRCGEYAEGIYSLRMFVCLACIANQEEADRVMGHEEHGWTPS
jgi:transposase